MPAPRSNGPPGCSTTNSRAYIATLPEVRSDGELTAVHGSPRDPIWEYISGPVVAAANFEAFETRLCLFGHTHLPVAFRAVDGEIDGTIGLPGTSAQLGPERAMLNPGSVGQPRDGLRDAAYAVLDSTPDPTRAPSSSGGCDTTSTARSD